MAEPMDVTDQLEVHKAKYDNVMVERPVPVEFDLRCLAAFDPNPVDDAALKSQSVDEYIRAWSRGGAQLLINAIFGLETESTEEGFFAKLPEMVSRLPRSKPVPKDAPKTRWEKFAATKGIQKRKKSRKVFDEATGEYKPRFGYKGKDSKMDDWLIPVPDNADPYEDQFQKKREEKRQRVDKNKMQQRRNAEEAWASEKGIDHREARKMQLNKLIVDSKTSTASFGRFDKKLENEGKIKIRREKRKFESTTIPAAAEKDAQMRIAEKIGKPKTKDANINIRKAVHNVRSKKSRTA
ncbi:Rhodanese-related sulfurtransferase [Polyrhizophydium stewartii]|uniref:Ribosome biogenesis regulatory protein n=1 Tax=Polyrhizophydium stewartii TaxID=2732419 RepID=A0ABR4N0M2_9FUNG